MVDPMGMKQYSISHRLEWRGRILPSLALFDMTEWHIDLKIKGEDARNILNEQLAFQNRVMLYTSILSCNLAGSLTKL